MKDKFQVSFVEPGFSPVQLDEGTALSEKLNVKNSPLLFGCRTGICGTCAILIHEESPQPLHPPNETEAEFLIEMAQHLPKCRLACQIELNTNLKIEKVTL